MNKNIRQYLFVALGSFLLAVAVTVFFVPSRITSGGVSTIGTVLYYIASIPLSVTNILANVVLFVFGYRLLGRKSVILTVYGIVMLTLFLELARIIPAYTEDIFIAVVGGGVISGVGIGLVIRNSGSTGGSDFLSIMIHRKYPHISVANIILFVDLTIIFVSGLVLGGSTVIVYSVIALYISSTVCDRIISFGNSTKLITVISPKYLDVSEKIQTYHNRGVTGIKCCGMYKKEDILMLYCVVSPREVPEILKTVKSIDGDAFIVISDSREVHGRGFIY